MQSRDSLVALGYLRSFVTLLVVAHHVALAYVPFAPPPSPTFLAEPRWWLVFPVLDPQRSPILALLVAFNDTFFMALMFLLSGLFVVQSLRRKGPAAFARDRARRLGVPFVVSALLLAPLAYFPAYLQTAASPSLSGYLSAWLALGTWPAGPAWFLWVLLAFDLVAAGVAALAPAWTRAAGRLAARLPTRPLPAVGLLVVLSAAAYVPLALAVGPLAWFTFGPFTAQTSRVLHYAVYFAAGMVVGATDLRAGLLDAGGALARRWSWWTIAALLAFVGSLVVFTLAAQHPTRPLLVGAAGVFVISCACSSVALLASFLRWLATPRAWLDHLGRHAYGIYLLHYAAVTWIQYALLAATVPASVKAIVVFVTAVGATWLVTTAVRRIPAVARIV